MADLVTGLATDQTTHPGAAAPLAPSPDPYQDHDRIKTLVRDDMLKWGKGREGIMRAAWRNILFYRGHQWIVFDRTQQRWRPSRLKRNTPTPVTNLFASTLDAATSVFAKIEPTLTFRPGTDEPEDRATADVAQRAIGVIEDEVAIRVNRQILAMWVGMTGGAWLETGYDPDPKHGTRLIQHEECMTCGAMQPPAEVPQCQTCGSGLLMPAIDPTGQPLGEQAPIGKMYVDVVPGFEMYFDASITDWSKQRKCCRQKSISLDEAKRRWPDLADQITPDSLGTANEFYAESLAHLAGHIDDTAGARMPFGPGASGGVQNNRVTEQWYSMLPTDEFPEGLLAIIVGKQHVAYAGPLPYRVKDGAPFLNYVYFPQKIVPGSAWGKTIADDLALKQAQRNRIESHIESMLMRTANPVWLKPAGSNVSTITGESGQVIEYNALGPSPAKPERIPGQGVPSGLMAFIQLIDKDFNELAATFEIIKGTRPEGVSAGIALQLLQERALSRFGPMFILWEANWAEWARQALEIFRQFATEERLLKIKGRDGAWQVSKFVGADLQGRVDVIPEAASSMPRSSILDRAEMEQLAALGVINLADPEIRFKFLEVYGRTNLTPAMAADTKNAIREDEAFAAMAQSPALHDPRVQQALMQALQMPDPATGQPSFDQLVTVGAQVGLQIPRVRPSVDDHGVHGREHGNWLKSESSQSLPPIVQRLAEAHKAEHDRLAALQMQSMVQARQGTNPTSGFLSNPGGQTSPMNAGSSGQRMMGDHEEMGQQMGGA